MATSRRVVIGGVCGFLLAGAVFAQRPEGQRGNPRAMMDRQVAELKKRLKLSDEQETKVRDIFMESSKKTMALREKYGPPEQGQAPAPEMMAEMRKIREESNTAIEKVLTPEQMKEYQKIEQERRERFGGGKRGPGGER